MSDPISSLRLQDAWRECERNGLINVACEAAANMYDMLAAIEKKLKLDHPAFDLGKPLPFTETRLPTPECPVN